MKKINDSLTSFSDFIGVLVLFGLGGLVAAGFVFFAAANTFDTSLMALAAVIAYASISALGSAVFGALLRLTARVIIEGTSNDIGQFGAEDLSFRSDSEPSDTAELQVLRVGKLTIFQRTEWDDAGQPDLSDWDGSIKFATWLRAQSDRRKGLW